MDPKRLKMYLDWVYESYMTYGAGHASSYARMVCKELQAEVDQFWADIFEERVARKRAEIVKATRWAGHNVIEVEA